MNPVNSVRKAGGWIYRLSNCTHKKTALRVGGAFLELNGFAFTGPNTSAKFLEDAFLLCLPIFLTSFFEDPIEFFLSLFTPFFDSGDEILFMGMA